ncbi:MAG: hypothetical protein ACP5G7_06875 [Anaerolineae bacterium]
MLDWLPYLIALALGAAIAWGAGRILVGSRRCTPPVPIEPDDPELTCTLVPAATAPAAIGDRTLWFAGGPTKGRSALIHPFGGHACKNAPPLDHRAHVGIVIQTEGEK